MKLELHPKTIQDTVVLVAEDDEPTQQLLKIYLANMMGIKTTYWAENGVKALNIYKNSLDDSTSTKTIDLILMDVKMPVMKGWEATKEIMSLANGRARILYQTCYDINSKPELRDTGALGIINKPLKPDQIKYAIENSALNYVLNRKDVNLDKALMNETQKVRWKEGLNIFNYK